MYSTNKNDYLDLFAFNVKYFKKGLLTYTKDWINETDSPQICNSILKIKLGPQNFLLIFSPSPQKQQSSQKIHKKIPKQKKSATSQLHVLSP